MAIVVVPNRTELFWLRRWESTGMIHHPDDGRSTRVWNVGQLQRDYTALYPRRLSSSYSTPWEPQIVHVLTLFYCYKGFSQEDKDIYLIQLQTQI
jgi:hypothetical protein